MAWNWMEAAEALVTAGAAFVLTLVIGYFLIRELRKLKAWHKS